MKVLQISDTHIGITKEKSIRKMLRNTSNEDFDLILHCGDYCGGLIGHKSVKSTVTLIRSFFPDKPFLSVIGNHDFWYFKDKKRPSEKNFNYNYQKIKEVFSENNVHFLDEDGIYQHPDFENIIFTGNSGWYNNPMPPTNDKDYLPLAIEGDTNSYLERSARNKLYKQLDQLDQIYEKGYHIICFVSHFPVVKAEDYKGKFELFSWDESISKLFQEDYDCKHFFCGHAHQLHKGPLRYECGTDYCNPKYHIIEV